MNSIAAEQGIVLVMVLLYLLVVTLLVGSVFSSSLLQIKMSRYFSHQALALQNTESALRIAEHAIKGNEKSGEGKLGADAKYYFFKRSEGCGVAYYEIQAMGVYGAAKSELASILSVPLKNLDACPGEHQQRRRVLWREGICNQ